jgi:hypothetical protein
MRLGAVALKLVPETFSDEIGDVHEQRGGPRHTFSNEFRGASDSLIERERPLRPLEASRRGRRLVRWVIVIAAALGGAGWALWSWSEPLGEWLLSWGAEDEVATASTPEPEPASPPQPAPQPEPQQPAALDETPSETTGEPTDEPGSPEPEPEPAPTPTPAKTTVTVRSTRVRGAVSSSRVSTRLAAVDRALQGCWTSAVAKPETKRPAEVTLNFSIRWNGRAQGISVSGDAPEDLRRCARDALPITGWPMSSDGGNVTVNRTWTLE